MEAAMGASESHSQSVPSEQQLAPPEEQPPSTSEGGGEDGEGEGEGGGEEQEEEEEEESGLMSKAQKLMDMITSSPDNPNPKVLHALASIMETEESSYMEESQSSSTISRHSHNIGQLANLVRENDDFFELISSKFLTDTRYSISIQAASARVLMCCSPTWAFPHVFEENVLERLTEWVMEDTAGLPGEVSVLNREPGGKENSCSDFEMRRTYSTGLLAVGLAGGGQVVEDVLNSGVSAKLMRYLRTQVLGDVSAKQKDGTHFPESKSTSVSGRSRDESRNRIRQILDAAPLDDSKLAGNGGIVDPTENDHGRSIGQLAHGEESWFSDELGDGFDEGVDDFNHDANADADDWHYGRTNERSKVSDRNGPGRSIRDEDFDENIRDDSSRRRMSRGWPRSKGRPRFTERTVEGELHQVSPGSGIRLGQVHSSRQRSLPENVDGKRPSNTLKFFNRMAADGFSTEREDNDDLFQECNVGSRDISDLVRSAVRAAETEARAADAPAEAIRAAGDAAAELVKTAALDELKVTNDEEAAVLAASRAAGTVIDAANAVKVSRSSSDIAADSSEARGGEPEIYEMVDFFIPKINVVAQQREKFCIQCLEILGEYVEVLGPVLHEKGVDVCLALLMRDSKIEESKVVTLLPDVLKLISALGAHRKFTALFVDRGGIQKLLLAPRMTQTFLGLSSCLFTIGSLQGIMERVCALPADIVHQVVKLGLQLLECPLDQARRNAALFFAAAFVFRAVLDVFDAQDGLQKFLNLLQGAASVRSGVNSIGPSATGTLRNDRSNGEVLTSSEKQIAFHTCVALRQYYRAHLILLVDSLRPNKSSRSAIRNVPSLRAAYKPLDISNEALDAIFLQIQKDRKLGPAIVRARWTAVDKLLACNGHITMLEFGQAPPVDRYLHDLLQYALGVLHIVTLVPYSRKLIVNATLSNDRVGVAVILDVLNGHTYLDPEIIQQALNVLVNLVCPPPSISNKPPLPAQNQQPYPVLTSNVSGMETRERNPERTISDRAAALPSQGEPRERANEFSALDRGLSVSSSQTPTLASGLVGDRRITLGPGAGCAGLAAQLEQGYRQARDAVRANNGIKVLLQLLQSRIISAPAILDCLRALACRVLLGLARDDTIAHILTKLQVGKKLSELIRDVGCQTPGVEQSRWQTELAQVAIELIGVVTNSGRASSSAARDAATPTLRRIERAAIAAATPITYHSRHLIFCLNDYELSHDFFPIEALTPFVGFFCSFNETIRELLLLIHEHLKASGLCATADSLLKEAQLTPLSSLSTPLSLTNYPSAQEPPAIQIHWPSGRAPRGFFSMKSKFTARDEIYQPNNDLAASLKKKAICSSSLPSKVKNFSSDLKVPYANKVQVASEAATETPLVSVTKLNSDGETQVKSPIILPMKRKLTDLREIASAPSGKRLNASEHGIRSPLFQTPNNARRIGLLGDVGGISTPSGFKDLHVRAPLHIAQSDALEDQASETPGFSQPGLPSDMQHGSSERLTLDSIVVQFLKHQHRQCPAPITTLPPLSLLHPHVCPEPKRSLDAPSNVTARHNNREFRSMYGGAHWSRKDRQFVYSRFRPWRTCRDDAAALLTCMTFLGGSSQVAVGSHSGELKLFDINSNNVLENCASHQSPVTLVQSYRSDGFQLVLSSSSYDVRLWDASSISGGPMHSFEGCRAARFSNSGTLFAALPPDPSRRDILLYDVKEYNLVETLSDTSRGSAGRGHLYSLVHFNHEDRILLWNGILWDRRSGGPVHRFDQFTDFGGGGFHPAGNEVIINSEVWDLRKFRLLRSVPSLDQTTITFNSSGDVIYAVLRRNIDDIMSAVQTRRTKHPLFSAFRTVDASNYTDIATVPVDRCVLDLATEPTESFVGLVTMDDQEEMYSSARVYEIGRRRPTDDDSDPDDMESDEEDEEDEDEDVDMDPLLSPDLAGDGDSDGDDSSDADDDSIAGGDDDYLLMDDEDFNGGNTVLEIVGEGDDDDSDVLESFSSEDDEFNGL
ncbi:hypothetical protein Dimus_010807 [Dionaea muscipula]